MNLGQQISTRQQALTESHETIARMIANGQHGPALESALNHAAAGQAELEQLQRAETLAAQRAAPISIARSSAAPAGSLTLARSTSDTSEPAGTNLARLAIAHVVAHRDRTALDATVASLFPDARGALTVARSQVGVADSSTATWAAELVRAETRAMLRTDLAPVSVAAALAMRGVSVEFNGAQSAVVPSITLRSTQAAGAWTGEGGVLPVVQGTIAAARLTRFKMGAVLPMTKELERASDPAAVQVMRTLLVQSTANLMDANLMDALPAVDGVRPAGLLWNVTPTAGAAGGGVAAVLADLQTLIGGLIAAGLGIKPVLIVNPVQYLALQLMTTALGEWVFEAELAKGKLRMADIISSPAVPAGTVVAVDAAVFGSAFDSIEVDLNDSATLTMANADGVAPTQAGDAPFGGGLGTPNQIVRDGGIPTAGGAGASVAGAVAISLWQTWSLALRLIVPASWQVLHAGGVQSVNAVTW